MTHDVTFHTWGNGRGVAAVNVKVYGSLIAADLARRVAADHGGDLPHVAPFADWVQACPEETRQYAWDLACECGWEWTQEWAREVYGAGYGVVSEGRSGGWAVLTYHDRPAFDRDDVAEWGPEAITQWDTFAATLRAEADDVPYQALASLYLNEYTTAAENAAKVGPDPFGLAGPSDPRETPRATLTRIAGVLSRAEWDADTTMTIAEILTDAGYTIAEPEAQS